jgi:hypothetical protein
MQHMPRRLLRDPKRPAHFRRGDSVLVVRKPPNRGQPLFKAQRRIFKDRAELGGEIPIAVCTTPTAARDSPHVNRPAIAARTYGAIRPTDLHKMRVGTVQVGEINDSFFDRRWFLHSLNLPRTGCGVKYITLQAGSLCSCRPRISSALEGPYVATSSRYAALQGLLTVLTVLAALGALLALFGTTWLLHTFLPAASVDTATWLSITMKSLGVIALMLSYLLSAAARDPVRYLAVIDAFAGALVLLSIVDVYGLVALNFGALYPVWAILLRAAFRVALAITLVALRPHVSVGSDTT